jgi:hypothetical protein
MTDFTSALARYIAALERSAATTRRAEDRNQYAAHLGEAARMFKALHAKSTEELKLIVAGERVAYGRSFLSGQAGTDAEAAFDEFAKQVEGTTQL